MIDEEKKFMRKVEESLTNNFSDWKVYKDSSGDYLIENKYNKFRIERQSGGDWIKITRPETVYLPALRGIGSFRRRIKQICHQYDHDQLVQKFQILNKLFDIRSALVLDISRYASVRSKKENKKNKDYEEFYNKCYNDLRSELDEGLSGKVIYIHTHWRNDVYMYFEKEKDMSFVILKYSDFLKM